ncbi:MAG: PUR family DNA/RNA-binding protein [Candidatus Marsarchaeota archaeon]|nr:PUR family DNA/RNA-binding protein [Candidatus Marsarchaeota archaeon]
MPNVRRSGSASKPAREPFTTIDDLIHLANELVAGLSKLGEYRHPLDVRRGVREEVETMDYADESQSIKAGSKTYFFDIKKTAHMEPYLVITESRFKGEGKDRERTSMVVFPEHAQEFLKTLQEMIEKLV